MVEVKNVTKQYGDMTVLEACTLSAAKGTIYALVGVNGVGKTTLLKLIAGFLQPSSGQVYVKGIPAWEKKEMIQRYIGSLIEAPVFYEHMSAKENLKLHLDYMNVMGDLDAVGGMTAERNMDAAGGMSAEGNLDAAGGMAAEIDMDAAGRIDSMLEKVGLENINDKPVSKFSMGMRQRLAIARTLLHQPEILILDEPFNGLDPVAANSMKNVLLSSAGHGMTILISSHILSDVAQLAETVGVLAEGRIQKEFRMADYGERDIKEFEHEVLTRMGGVRNETV